MKAKTGWIIVLVAAVVAFAVYIAAFYINLDNRSKPRPLLDPERAYTESVSVSYYATDNFKLELSDQQRIIDVLSKYTVIWGKSREAAELGRSGLSDSNLSIIITILDSKGNDSGDFVWVFLGDGCGATFYPDGKGSLTQYEMYNREKAYDEIMDILTPYVEERSAA